MSDEHPEKHPEIARAIQTCGGQVPLALKAGVRQQTISKLLNRQHAVSAEVAVKIERATEGKVTREDLRPDIFRPTPAHMDAAS
ncbi:MAG: transcriptional regulator [Pseudomonadota bacterium]